MAVFSALSARVGHKSTETYAKADTNGPRWTYEKYTE